MKDKEQAPFSLEIAKELFYKNGLEKLFVVEFKGKDRKARTDKSYISELRWFIQLCSEYGIPRSVMLKSIQKFDDRFKDYNLLAFNLYCSRMFKLTPIDDKKDTINKRKTERILDGRRGGGIISPKFPYAFFITLFFILFSTSTYAHPYEQCESDTKKEKNRPKFMNDDYYLQSGTIVDSVGKVSGNMNAYKYRTQILNSSYNIEKGKILSTLIGNNNGYDTGHTQARFHSAQKSIFNLKQVIEKEKAFNKLRNIKIKNQISKNIL